MAARKPQSAFQREAKLERRRKQKRPSIAVLRIGELNRLFAARYGPQLPDDDAGRDDAALMAHHLSQLGGDPRRRIADWLRTWAPWLSIAAAERLMTDAIMLPRRWKADALAWRLRLHEADRKALGITTIGAIDRGKGTREGERREAARAAKEAKRRAAGVKPRHVYEAASANKLRPWEAEGVSRRTWYRRRLAQPRDGGTSPATA